MSVIRAVYEVRCAAGEVERLARHVAVEQTVEVPESLITPDIDERIVGDVAAVEPRDEGRFAVTIEYATELAHGQLPQLLNLVYGNVSMMDVRLVDLVLPDDLLACFEGPNCGVAGLRAHLGVEGRPLLSTALKPRGLSVDDFAAIAGEFALGGGDIVKDDHNLVGDFERRVSFCQAAVEEANARAGRNCIYAASLYAPVEELDARIAFALARGVRAFMIAPMIYGLDTVRRLAADHPVVIIAHPTFTGAFQRHGVEPGLLLGTLFRLAGVDVSIFTNHGGRFALSPDECSGIARRLREPLGKIAPGWPSPAGGMQLDRLGEMARQYGADTVLLIGGALLERGGSVRDSTAALLDRIRGK